MENFQQSTPVSNSMQIAVRYMPLTIWAAQVFSSGMSETKARRLARAGEIEGAIKIGGSWFVDLAYESKKSQKLQAMISAAVGA